MTPEFGNKLALSILVLGQILLAFYGWWNEKNNYRHSAISCYAGMVVLSITAMLYILFEM